MGSDLPRYGWMGCARWADAFHLRMGFLYQAVLAIMGHGHYELGNNNSVYV